MNAPAHVRERQRGVALLVVMILLFVLSVTGVYAMRDAGLERRMAANAAFAEAAFQAAESATEVVLNDSANLSAAWGAPGNTVHSAPDVKVSDDFSIEADLTYLGEGPAPGYSLGQTGNGFVSLRYDVRGAAAIDALNAGKAVRQGAYRIAPSN